VTLTDFIALCGSVSISWASCCTKQWCFFKWISVPHMFSCISQGFGPFGWFW